MLGPVLERLHNELLDPLIDRVFQIALNANLLGEIPEPLQGRELKVEYISVLAQAQRIVATGNIEQAAGYISNLAQIWPNARHKFNAEKSIEEYAEAIGVSPELIRSDEEVMAMVQQEQEQMQAQQMAEQGSAMAQSAKTLSDTEMTNENSALNRLMGMAGMTGG